MNCWYLFYIVSFDVVYSFLSYGGGVVTNSFHRRECSKNENNFLENKTKKELFVFEGESSDGLEGDDVYDFMFGHFDFEPDDL